LRAALLFALCFLLTAPAWSQAAVPLTVTPLRLNPEDKTQTRAGPLIWRGGFSVTADDPRFGGLSDLCLSENGRELTAVTDQGHWLTARLTYDAAGNLDGVSDARMGSLRDPRGLLLTGKAQQDAEALARLDGGGWAVAFERDHRLHRYDTANLGGLPREIAPPPGLTGASDNGGLEALVALAGDRLLAFTEGQEAGSDYAVYLREADGRWQALTLKPKGLFVPTGAAQLPDGDILLLERRFTLLGGLSARLRRIPLASIRPGSLLHGQEVVELRPPLTLDNFEGLAVHRLGDGSLRLTLVSDDNFSPLQRTLIVQFEWPAAK
jgi:YD repeat-containing protein